MANRPASFSAKFQRSTVADGNYDFNTDAPSNPQNIVEYFTFVNSAGVAVNPTAGTVTITADSGNGVFQTLNNNTFNAADARSTSRTKTSGLGRAQVLRVTLAGVTGNGVAGFELLFSQGRG